MAFYELETIGDLASDAGAAGAWPAMPPGWIPAGVPAMPAVPGFPLPTAPVPGPPSPSTGVTTFDAPVLIAATVAGLAIGAGLMLAYEKGWL